jgi:hypothetical protein
MATDEALLAKILAEKATHQIAEALGLPPEEYAKRVLFFVRNPKAEPQLNVLTPQQEREAGIPSVEDALDYVDKLASGEIPMGDEHLRTRFAGFDGDEKSAVTATGATPKKGPQRAPPLPGDPPTSR